jgi:diaminopropionate ammonia-lyase
MRVSQERGWLLVSDTSWPGYEEIPAFVAQGYTILAEEALNQMQEMGVSPPTHVFLQAGVGGFASSIAGYLSTRLGDEAPTVIIVEPDRAACLYASAVAGEVTRIVPEKATIMAMLECHTPSLIAWRILERTAHAFMTVTDDDARDAMRQLAFRQPGLPGIVAGESGAAGLAGLVVLSRDEGLRAAVGLNASSRVLLINTETATDPSSYEEIVGTAPSSIGRAA